MNLVAQEETNARHNSQSMSILAYISTIAWSVSLMTQRLEINKPSFFDFSYRLHAAPRRWMYPRHLRICFSQLHHFDPFCITSGFQLNGTSLHSFHVLLRHQQYEVVVAEGQHGKCSIAPVTTEVSNPCTIMHMGARLGFHSGNFSDIYYSGSNIQWWCAGQFVRKSGTTLPSFCCVMAMLLVSGCGLWTCTLGARLGRLARSQSCNWRRTLASSAAYSWPQTAHAAPAF